MFCLDRAIADWRNELTAKGHLSASDVDELQVHLREQTEQLLDFELTEEEAFLVARHRLGDPDRLAGEFAKVNRPLVWSRRFFWMIVGVLAFAGVQSVGGVAGAVCELLGARLGVGGRLLGLAGVSIHAMVLLTALIFALITCLLARPGSALDRLMRGVLIGLIAVLPVLVATRQLAPTLTVRFLGAAEYGQMALASSYASIALSLASYLIMGGLLLLLRKRTRGVWA